MSGDDKRVIRLVTTPKPVEYGQTDFYIEERDKVIDEIVTGKRNHIIIVAGDEENPPIFITDMDFPDSNATLDTIKFRLIMDEMNGISD